MTKSRRLLAVFMAVVLTMSMAFAMTSTVFAGTDDSDFVTVSVTKNNFEADGTYKGTTNNPYPLSTGKTIVNYEVPIAEVDEWIQGGLKSYYLPEGTTDPMDGKASVLDAIIVALADNDITDIDAGWDSTYDPAKDLYPGGYIHNLDNVDVSNTYSTFPKDGYIWGKSVGHGWNIACTGADGKMYAPSKYASNIPLKAGMNIIIDYDYYDMEWNTGTPVNQ